MQTFVPGPVPTEIKGICPGGSVFELAPLDRRRVLDIASGYAGTDHERPDKDGAKKHVGAWYRLHCHTSMDSGYGHATALFAVAYASDSAKTFA